MSGSPQYVSFASPQSIIAPDLSVEEQQLMRRQQLIDALRGQSLQPINGNGGAVSWTQGLSKLADALVARSMQKSNDARAVGINQTYAQRLGSMFGGGTAPASNAANTPSTPAQTGMISDAPPVTGAATGSPGSLNSSSPPASAPATTGAAPVSYPPPSTVAPSGASQAATPLDASASPTPTGRYPLALSGNQQTDMLGFSMAPEAYIQAWVSSHAPTDFTKLLMQSGIDPNSPIGRQIMQTQLAKQNYVAPVNGRPGSAIRDPYDPSRVIGYDAPNIEGAFPQYGTNGMPTGYQQADGAVPAMAAAAKAAAAGKAAGQAPYDLVTVVGPDGTQYLVPKASLLGGGTQQSDQSSGGSLNQFYGNTGATGPALPGGAPAGSVGVAGLGPSGRSGATTAGTNSANAFNDAIRNASGAKDAIFLINGMLKGWDKLPTGTGAEITSQAKSAVNAALGAMGQKPFFDPGSIAQFDEIKKNAAALGLRLSQASGQGSTDARLKSALDALPSAHYSPAARNEVGLNLKALYGSSLAYGQAASNYMQTHGPDSFPQFQREWQNAYNPDIFYYREQGTQKFGKWASRLSAAQRTQVLQQYRAMKSLGAF